MFECIYIYIYIYIRITHQKDAPGHIDSDIITRFIEVFGYFDIIFLCRIDPADSFQSSACILAPLNTSPHLKSGKKSMSLSEIYFSIRILANRSIVILSTHSNEWDGLSGFRAPWPTCSHKWYAGDTVGASTENARSISLYVFSHFLLYIYIYIYI